MRSMTMVMDTWRRVIGSVGCDPPIKLGGDCNDTDPTQDASIIWYSDVDGDGFGDVNNAFVCARNAITDVQDSQDQRW